MSGNVQYLYTSGHISEPVLSRIWILRIKGLAGLVLSGPNIHGINKITRIVLSSNPINPVNPANPGSRRNYSLLRDFIGLANGALMD
jgi:hypothetical protein